MKRTMRAFVSVFAAAGLAAALAACDDDVVEDPVDTEITDEETTDEEEEDGDAADASSADPGDITPPGTELAIGETAIVPFRDSVISLTVTAIEEGDNAEFQSQFDDADELVPYYVWVEAENVGGEDLDRSRVPQLRAVTEDLRNTGVVLFGSRLGECEPESFPEDAGPGDVVQSCTLEAAPSGMTLGGVQYQESDGGYRNDPITWRS